jgi:hypothetical protein
MGFKNKNLKSKTCFMVKKLSQWVAILVVSGVIGCYPKGADLVEEIDLVYTNHDGTFNFASKHTYSIPDSVVEITGDVFNDPDGNHKPQFMPAATGDVILKAMNDNMTAAGWTRVTLSQNPDVLMLVSSMTTTNLYWYYDWYYWYWWYGGWWGWYYPCCYYPMYVTGYRSGSVMTQMVDATTTKPGSDKATVVWNMVLNGLAEGGTTNIASRVQTGVSQAFAQSPYLKH